MPKQIKFEDIRHEGCQHCIHNKDATKPYIKMKTVDLDNETLKLYEKAAEITSLNRNCIMCVALHRLMAMPEQDLYKLLEEAVEDESES